MTRAPLYRVLDVNINRSKEALRVCEEVFRFVFLDATMYRALRAARHRITVLAHESRIAREAFPGARDTENDCGKFSRCSAKRNTVRALLFSNFARAKESLRVLEEFFYLVDKKTSQGYKELRFKVYALEKKAVAMRFKASRTHQ